MKPSSRVFLVLLRLAIGWHFFFEGLEKIQSVYLGDTTTNHRWSSEPYLRQANGAFGQLLRDRTSDPDKAASERLSVLPLPPEGDSARTLLHARIPRALANDWNEYFDRFVKHYRLEDAEPVEDRNSRHHQIELASKKMEQCEDNTVYWLLNGTKKIRKAYPSGSVEVDQTTPQRIADYKLALQEVQAMQDKDLPAFGRDVYKEKLRDARSAADRLRNDLMKELDEQTEEMKKALETVLTDGQKKNLGPVPPSDQPRAIDRVDRITMWGLLVVGACLLLGLFTRTACVAGALFLLLFYLAMPPLPWLPENVRTEGHYLFVNKNLIEMLALLALATTRSGRWAGLDALLQFLNPYRWRAHAIKGADFSTGIADRQNHPTERDPIHGT